MLTRRLAPLIVILALTAWVAVSAQGPAPTDKSPEKTGLANDLELVEKLIAARRDYQKSLEVLRAHYLKVGDIEKGKWAEEELIGFHRTPKHAFRLDLDVPPPTLPPEVRARILDRLRAQD